MSVNSSRILGCGEGSALRALLSPHCQAGFTHIKDWVLFKRGIYSCGHNTPTGYLAQTLNVLTYQWHLNLDKSKHPPIWWVTVGLCSHRVILPCGFCFTRVFLPNTNWLWVRVRNGSRDEQQQQDEIILELELKGGKEGRALTPVIFVKEGKEKTKRKWREG